MTQNTPKPEGTSRRKHILDRGLDDPGSALIEVEQRMWSSINSQTRIEQLAGLDERYHRLLDELYNSANLCVDRYQSFLKAHSAWRRIVIIGTGIIAVLNLLAANKEITALADNVMAVIAAVCAVVLAILANLESFHNSLERAQGYRESRELFLDAAREFDRRWGIYVRPFGESPEACVNASELYRQVVVKDRELRAKFRELTRTEGKTTTGRRP